MNLKDALRRDSQNRIDLAYKLHPDRQRSLGDGAAKLNFELAISSFAMGLF